MSARIFYLAAAILTMISVHSSVHACSALSLTSPSKVIVGKSYDWFFFHGHGYLYTNLRGVPRSALILDNSVNPAQWVSKYGSVSFTQFGRGFPIGGMNEQGLVVEMLQLESASYNEADTAKPFVNEGQWSQYQLDNAATVEEVVASLEKLRIVKGYTGIHYFITDASGQSAVIEFTDGSPRAYFGSGLPVPALTNDTYPESLKFLARRKKKPIRTPPSSRYSDIRFRTLANFIAQNNSEPSVPAAWRALESVRLNGFVTDALLEPSQWNIVYDVTARTIHFKTRRHPSVKTIKLSDVDFSPAAQEKMLNMNIPAAGNIAGLLIDYSPELNAQLINKNNWLIDQYKLDRAIEHAAKELQN